MNHYNFSLWESNKDVALTMELLIAFHFLPLNSYENLRENNFSENVFVELFRVKLWVDTFPICYRMKRIV